MTFFEDSSQASFKCLSMEREIKTDMNLFALKAPSMSLPRIALTTNLCREMRDVMLITNFAEDVSTAGARRSARERFNESASKPRNIVSTPT